MKNSKVVESVKSGESKIYSSAQKGRIVNVSVNGIVKSSLTECVLSVKEGWSNKNKDAIKLWNRVNSKLSKDGQCKIVLDDKEYEFKLVEVK